MWYFIQLRWYQMRQLGVRPIANIGRFSMNMSWQANEAGVSVMTDICIG